MLDAALAAAAVAAEKSRSLSTAVELVVLGSAAPTDSSTDAEDVAVGAELVVAVSLLDSADVLVDGDAAAVAATSATVETVALEASAAAVASLAVGALASSVAAAADSAVAVASAAVLDAAASSAVAVACTDDSVAALVASADSATAAVDPAGVDSALVPASVADDSGLCCDASEPTERVRRYPSGGADGDSALSPAAVAGCSASVAAGAVGAGVAARDGSGTTSAACDGGGVPPIVLSTTGTLAKGSLASFACPWPAAVAVAGASE